MPVAKLDVAEEKDKPVFDEQTLARLLEAAFVLQEHNRELRLREVNLEIQRDQLGAEERAASARHAVAQSPSAAATAGTGDNNAASSQDYTQTLAQIVETQRQIQARNLQLQATMEVIAERVREIAHAGGAAVGILSTKIVRYRAIAGVMTLPNGTEVELEKALCVASLRTGQVIRCNDVNAEFLLDVEECQRRGIQSMIGVPVYHDGGIAGGLELYYATAQAFTEQDVHTCQLMAGLITEALVREAELASQKSIAEQRAAMREALEKVTPVVAAISSRVNKAAGATAASATSRAKVFTCRKCGHALVGEEQFCGNCGTPRSGDYGPPSLQSKVASLWEMQEAKKKTSAASSEDARSEAAEPPEIHSLSEDAPAFARPGSGPAASSAAEPPSVTGRLAEHSSAEPDPSRADSSEHQPAGLTPLRVPLALPDEIAIPVLPAGNETHALAEPVSVEEDEDLLIPEEETALDASEQPWSSAAAAKNYLEEIAGGKRPSGILRFLSDHRGDIYLAVAVIVVAIVIRWGIWSNPAVSATGNTNAAVHKSDPNADLSWFDRMLVSLGLADAPPTPESKGNPDTQVWVDLHTALYYCPGADLYGKTPKGKYTSQRDAQLDSFGPASGRPCD